MINQSEKVDTLKTIQLTEFDDGKLRTICNTSQSGKSHFVSKISNTLLKRTKNRPKRTSFRSNNYRSVHFIYLILL